MLMCKIKAIKQTGRRQGALLHRILFICSLMVLNACTSYQISSANYADLAERASKGENISIKKLKSTFVASEDFAERMERLIPLEQNVLEIIEDQPLKLGAIGATILDNYYGSITGHMAMQTYYRYLEVEDAALVHENWINRLVEATESKRDGSTDLPYAVISSVEAESFLRLKQLSTVGSIYVASSDWPLNLMIIAADQDNKHENVIFDLTTQYDVIREQIETKLKGKPFSTGLLINHLASQEDGAAQAWIGAFLIYEQRYEDAIRWLNRSTRSGNVLSTLMLARIFQMQARSLDGEVRTEALELALDHYLRAIAQGSDEAMYVLGQLYISEVYGEDNVPSGHALLLQAAQLDNADAKYMLGFYYMNRHSEHFDLDKSEQFFYAAATQSHTPAQLQLARFLTAEKRPFSKEVIKWIKQLAKDDDPEAHIVLGNLYARGGGVKQNLKRALLNYEAAVDLAPDNSAIINEIAWTLAVTEIDALKQPDFAFRIMSNIMVEDSDAMLNSAYLDTFAAASAAKGNFTRAIELQTLAIKSAIDAEQHEDLEILKEHLEDFINHRVIIDTVP